MIHAILLALAGCAVATPPCESPACEPLPGRHVRLGDARPWVVELGRGEPIVFVHGVPTSSYLWRNVQRALADEHRTVSFDLLGLGRSAESGDRGLDLESQAELLAELLDALDIDEAVLVAHDVGGGVAQIFMSRYPDRVRALVAIDAVAFVEYWPVPLVELFRIPPLGELAALLAPVAAIVEGRIAAGLHRPERLAPAVSSRYAAPFRDLGGRMRLLSFVRGLDPPRVERAVRANALGWIPTLVLWAEHDRFQPLEQGRRLRDALRASRFAVIDDAGHFAPEEKPREIADALRVFLRSLLP